jgi:hypothetical protein
MWCCNGICQPAAFGGSCNVVCCRLYNGQYAAKSQVCCTSGGGTVVSGQDCDVNGMDDRCQLAYADCNGDGTLSACELDPAEQDCDGNNVCNAVDIAGCPGGPANCDCNTNGLPDACETNYAPWFTTRSRHSPFDYVASLPAKPEHRIPNAPDAYSDVEVSFRAKADLEASNEHVGVYLVNGLYEQFVGNAYFGASGVTCPSSPYFDSVDSIDAADFDNARDNNGGIAILRLYPTSYVGTCTNSFIEVTVAYLTALDCDGNLVPDECDPDCDLDDIPDECEITIDDGGVCVGPGCSHDCQPNEIPDECDIAGPSNDCEPNGVPDECAPDDCDNDDISDFCEIRDCPPGNPGCDDCNGNGIPDSCDIAAGSPDCQGNQIPDVCDIDPSDPDGNGQVSADCEPNGVPDECAPADCDNDDIPDFCELRDCPTCNAPDCKDCNGNGVPDSCDISSGFSIDCPAYVAGRNGVPDSCDPDCNGNGVSDRCDIASGLHADCDADGIPDACQLAAEGTGSRYLTIRLNGILPYPQPPGIVAGVQYALRVIPKSPNLGECGLQYVQNNGTLGSLPVYKTPAQWCPLGVNARDEMIVPDSNYTVEAQASGGGSVYLGTSSTQIWGDVTGPYDAANCRWTAPDGYVTSADDCAAIIDGLYQEPDAPQVRRADISGGAGCVAADGMVFITDISSCNAIVQNGIVYPCMNGGCMGGMEE